jgi:2',3'-cyclic-nucleotide 2'-phosphodiesterase (5'-nucleotidase family)
MTTVKSLCPLLLLIIITSSCKAKHQLASTQFSKTKIEQIPADSTITALITNYKNQLSSKMNEVIAFSEVGMTKEFPESILGNFVTDALLEYGRSRMGDDTGAINIALLNNGGLRSSLPKGEITVGNIYELMPFDNQLVAVKLSASAMKELFQYIAIKGGAPIAGFRIKITKDKKVESVYFDNKKFDNTKNYYVITSDYLLSGGDNMQFFKDPEKIVNMNETLRDVLINYCRMAYIKGVKFNPKKDGRVSIAE